eukprot:Em0021g207a
MASKPTTKKSNTETHNLFAEEQGDPNNGHQYRNSNRRHGLQCLNIVHNDLSENSSSSSSEDEVICEGCGIEAQLFNCDAYQCNDTHHFCNACCFKPACPVDGFPPKP